MVVEKFRQLLAQALVLLALVTVQHGTLELLLLQFLRQFAPQICGGGAEHEKIAPGNVVDDLVRMFAHRQDSQLQGGTPLPQSTSNRAAFKGRMAATHTGPADKSKQ